MYVYIYIYVYIYTYIYMGSVGFHVLGLGLSGSSVVSGFGGLRRHALQKWQPTFVSFMALPCVEPGNCN